MSHSREQSHHPRADSPPIIERISTPPTITRTPTSRYRPESPPLITRIPTPPFASRPRTPSARTETRTHSIQTHRPKPRVTSKLYNLFHPRQRRVEIIETPVRQRRTRRTATVYETPPSPSRVIATPAGGHHRPSRGISTPPLTPAPSRPPYRTRQTSRMSPQIPGDNYVPMPDPLPSDEPTPPISTHGSSKRNSRSPRHLREYYPHPFEPHEGFGDAEQPTQVIKNRPIRVKPSSQQANLLAENQKYRDQIKRFSQELDEKNHAIEDYKARAAELQDRLARAQDHARRDQRDSSHEIDQLRDRLQQCLQDRDEQQRRIEDRDRELDHLRREPQRSTVIHYDNDRRARTARQTSNSSGMDVIREAQDDARRGGRRGY